ncbi:MAG TPA: adenylate kinase [Candidatus Dojkabacteria bacterium]|jgi:adenylate kinase
MIYVIFGIPGVGKTSVVNEVIHNTGIKQVNMGDLLTQVGVEKGMIETRDELRKLPYRSQQKLRGGVIEKIQFLHEKEKNILIDTHATVKTPQGYMPGFDREMLEKLDPDVFIVLWAQPDAIMARRQEDDSRQRDEDSRKEIEEGLRLTRQMASIYSVLANATYVEVENIQNNLESAVKNIVDVIK